MFFKFFIFFLSIFLKTTALFSGYSCLDLNTSLDRDSHRLSGAYSSSSQYSSNKHLQEVREQLINNMCNKAHTIAFVQNMSQSEIADCLGRVCTSNLFECYYLYHVPNYIRYIRSLAGYDDFILELHDKLENNHRFRKKLRYVDGFDGKYGFKDFISREAKRVREERATQEVLRQDVLRKQCLEEARVKQEAQHALIIRDSDVLLELRDKYLRQQEIIQESGDQEFINRYEQRMRALNETIKNNGKLFDYSQTVDGYNFTDPYRIVFKHTCGTALDKQLHQELCDTRTRITELLITHRDNFQIQDLYHVVTYFTALAKEEQNSIVAFNLSDFSYYLVKAAQGLGRASDVIFKGTARGVKNLFKHNLAFCQALVTHPIDDIIKPLTQAGMFLGKALYEGLSLGIKDPKTCSQKVLSLARGLANEVVKDPEAALATVVELFLSFKATSVLKLKNAQGLTRFFSQQERVIDLLRGSSEIAKKIIVPIKHVISEAAHLVNVGIEHGKMAIRNLVNVIREQPEVVAISDIASLKLGPECYKDAAKLSDKIMLYLKTPAKKSKKEFGKNQLSISKLSERFVCKIRNIGDDILDVMERMGGHTLEKHVGKTNNELLKRVKQSLFIESASTFTNKRIAIKAVKENLRNNAEEIARWLVSNPPLNDQIVIEFLHKYPIGRSILKGKANPIYNLIKSKIVLKPDPTQNLGFKLLTAFPIGK